MGGFSDSVSSIFTLKYRHGAMEVMGYRHAFDLAEYLIRNCAVDGTHPEAIRQMVERALADAARHWDDAGEGCGDE